MYAYGNLPEQLFHMFTYTSNVHAHNTRIMSHIRSSNFSNIIIIHSILYKGPYIWNSLTTDIKEKVNIHCFIRYLKKSIIGKYTTANMPI